jgi:3-dehydroquinate synthase II
MTRDLWLRLDPKTSKEEGASLLRAAKGQVSTVVLERDEDLALAKYLGLRTASKNSAGDIHLIDKLDEWSLKKARVGQQQVAIQIEIEKKEDVDRLVKFVNQVSPDYVLITCRNWKVIPLENIIATIHGKSHILAEASSATEVKAALETLELGADGAILETRDPKEIDAAALLVREVKTRSKEKDEEEETVKLEPARIIAVKPLSIGARACIDTCDMMKLGEGILLGSSSSALFLVQAEVADNPHVASRPFRVNAGPVSLYALVPKLKTRYVSELKTGEEVLIVNKGGKTRKAIVGRLKIEWRPMALIEAECRDRRIKTIVQNAETVQLVTKEGAKSVADLKPGDEVLVHVEEGGRHFGTLVKEENIIER